jgi:hypothetical protein
MPARSKITQLPPEIKAEFDKLLIEKNFSDYDGIIERLNVLLQDAGSEIRVSRSGAHRYGKGFEEKIAAIKLATEQAKAVAEAAGDDQGSMNQALIRLVQQKAFDALIEAESADGLPKMGTMIAKLSKADIDNRKDAREVRKQALEQAADVVDEMAKQQGMNEDQARFWREKVLMGA